ncbi:MAG TPA: electron transfer flavoprotein subunit beta/FixA family protein, partial [Chitinophagales bacterium]|nr:electron transfer flavoprotein subunit beta/FixA family protein [Chitinophagales bacterium]
DEWYALVRAIELKESNGGTVTVINVGPIENEQYIRKALALGADDAVRIDVDPQDAFQTAENIANYAKSNSYDLILTGKETIDYNGGVVGGFIAAIADLPYVSFASKLEMQGNTLHIEREIEGVVEIVELEMPCVVSAQKGMAEARIPNMRGILASKTKPLQVVAANSVSAAVQSVQFNLPPAKESCKMISAENPEELIDLLHNEAKVI